MLNSRLRTPACFGSSRVRGGLLASVCFLRCHLAATSEFEDMHQGSCVYTGELGLQARGWPAKGPHGTLESIAVGDSSMSFTHVLHSCKQ